MRTSTVGYLRFKMRATVFLESDDTDIYSQLECAGILPSFNQPVTDPNVEDTLRNRMEAGYGYELIPIDYTVAPQVICGIKVYILKYPGDEPLSPKVILKAADIDSPHNEMHVYDYGIVYFPAEKFATRMD